MKTGAPIISIEGLRLGYPGRSLTEAFSTTVFAGEFVSVIGVNGAGKTTFIRTLLGLQKPLEGRIEVHGHGIGYLPQAMLSGTDFPATVREIVMTGFAAKTHFSLFPSKEEREIAERNMRYMNVADIANAPFRALSGGQRQKTLLARALCAAGDVILLDEPLNNLDEDGTRAINEAINRLNSDGKTIVMITHGIDAALRRSDRIILIQRDPICAAKEDFNKIRSVWGIVS